MKSYVLEFSHVWSCHKNRSRSTQGHSLNCLGITPVSNATLPIKFLSNQPTVSRFLPQAWWPCWSNDLDYLNKLFFPQPQEALWNFVTIGLVAFEEMFETVILWEYSRSKVKKWPWPLVLRNLHVLIKATLITKGQNPQNFPSNLMK